MFPGNSILFRHLVLQMSLSFLKHIELLAQGKDGIFRRILPLLSRAAAEPRPHSDGHLLAVKLGKVVDKVLGWNYGTAVIDVAWNLSDAGLATGIKVGDAG